MAQVTRIHQDKRPHRIHFIAEWAERRNLDQVDIVKGTGADKGTVSRWFAGALPSEKYLLMLTDAMECDEPHELFTHPDDDWIARFFRERKSEDERSRARAVLEAAFPKRA